MPVPVTELKNDIERILAEFPNIKELNKHLKQLPAEQCPKVIRTLKGVRALYEKDHSLLNRASFLHDPVLLKLILLSLPDEERLAALKELDECGYSTLNSVSFKPKHLIVVLESLSPQQCLEAIQEKGNTNNSLFDLSISIPTTEILTIIIKRLSPEQLFTAITVQDENGCSILNSPALKPHHLRLILKKLPKEQHIQAINTAPEQALSLLEKAIEIQKANYTGETKKQIEIIVDLIKKSPDLRPEVSRQALADTYSLLVKTITPDDYQEKARERLRNSKGSMKILARAMIVLGILVAATAAAAIAVAGISALPVAASIIGLGAVMTGAALRFFHRANSNTDINLSAAMTQLSNLQNNNSEDNRSTL